jgi:hypothetical protein
MGGGYIGADQLLHMHSLADGQPSSYDSI